MITPMGKTKIHKLQRDRSFFEAPEVALEQADPKIQKMLNVALEDVKLGRTMGLEELDNELGSTDEEPNT